MRRVGQAGLIVSLALAMLVTVTLGSLRAQQQPWRLVSQPVQNPAGTATTGSFVMMGLGGIASGKCWFIPQTSGFVSLQVTGSAANGTATDGGIGILYYGTGTPPANGAAPPAGAIQSSVSFTFTSTGAAQSLPFNLAALLQIAPSSALGQPPAVYWFDIGLHAVTGGTATIAGVSCSGNEE